MDATEILMQNVDKSQLPPLHQKRILAFVNHFLISSCSFLNDFAVHCETKFIDLERKLQKVEAALTIIEAKLASIPSREHIEKDVREQDVEEAVPEKNHVNDIQPEKIDESPKGIKISEHGLYKKFFKMLQVGVPAQAIKMKMQVEGLDPNLLDDSNILIPFDEGKISSKES